MPELPRQKKREAARGTLPVECGAEAAPRDQLVG
jgi:hypothetical protein